jgi:hypothetical protein
MGGSLEVSQASSFNREGQELKRWYQDCRAAITFSYNKWSRSGQKDPESFHNFVPKPSTGISTLGKRVRIMGAALRIGGLDEVSEVLTFTLRQSLMIFRLILYLQEMMKAARIGLRRENGDEIRPYLRQLVIRSKYCLKSAKRSSPIHQHSAEKSYKMSRTYPLY